MKTSKRIKIYQDGNEYIKTDSNMWVRNFTKTNCPQVDLNKTYNPSDYFVFLKNEIQNSMQKHMWVNHENLNHDKILIISDGFNFEKKQKILASIPKDITVIGVLGSLAKWNTNNRNMDYYVVNNPYKDCVKYFGKRHIRNFPKCIASLKTNSDFVANYRGRMLKYLPVYEGGYTSKYAKETDTQIDDYRNPICAAIQLAFMFNAYKIFLYCCDDSFEGERPSAEKLENGLYQYPQQRIAHEIIDANLFWLKMLPYQEIKIFYNSNGLKFENATYIEEDEILNVMK